MYIDVYLDNKMTQEVTCSYAKLREVLEECKDLPVEFKTTMLAMIDQWDKQVPIRPKFDVDFIKEVDKFLGYKDTRIAFVKYETLDDVLRSDRIFGIIISINGTCYTFETEEMYDKFRELFSKHIMYSHKMYTDKINVYHMIPANMKQKAILLYHSVDTAELKLVKKRLAELSGTDDITIKQLDKERSMIIFHDKINTYPEMTHDLCEYRYSLMSKFQDEKVDVFKTEMIGSVSAIVLSIMDRKIKDLEKTIELRPITITIQDSVINAVGNNTGTVTQEGNVSKMVKKKKKTTEDIATEWVEAHPYDAKKSRGEYHKRYVRHMKRDDKKHLSIAKFADVMRDLSYTEGGTGKHKIWEKVEDEITEDENESSSDDE